MTDEAEGIIWEVNRRLDHALEPMDLDNRPLFVDIRRAVGRAKQVATDALIASMKDRPKDQTPYTPAPTEPLDRAMAEARLLIATNYTVKPPQEEVGVLRALLGRLVSSWVVAPRPIAPPTTQGVVTPLGRYCTLTPAVEHLDAALAGIGDAWRVVAVYPDPTVGADGFIPYPAGSSYVRIVLERVS